MRSDGCWFRCRLLWVKPDRLRVGDPAVDRPVDDRLGGAPANACGLWLGPPWWWMALPDDWGQDAIGEALFFRGCLLSVVSPDSLPLLQRDAERPVSQRIVLVRRARDGERQFQGFDGDRVEGGRLCRPGVGAGCLPPARWLLIGTLPLAAPTSASALLSAVRQASSQGTAIALDVNWRPTVLGCQR